MSAKVARSVHKCATNAKGAPRNTKNLKQEMSNTHGNIADHSKIEHLILKLQV